MIELRYFSAKPAPPSHQIDGAGHSAAAISSSSLARALTSETASESDAAALLAGQRTVSGRRGGGAARRRLAEVQLRRGECDRTIENHLYRAALGEHSVRPAGK